MIFDDITIQLKQSNKDLNLIGQNTNETNEYLELSIDTFKQGFSNLIDFFKGQSLAQLEEKREMADVFKKLLAKNGTASGASATVTNDDKTFNGLITNFKGLNLVLGTLAATAGVTAGLFAGFVNNLRLTLKAFKAVIKPFSFNVSGFTKFVTTVQTFTTGLSKFIGYIGNRFSVLSEMIKSFASNSTMLSKLKGVFTFFANIGKKLLTPLFVIYETVKGAIEGYDAEGFVGLIKGAIVGFFKGFIGEFLDLIKSAVSWVAGFLGFEEVEKLLDSFSFVDLFKNIIDSIFTLASDIVGWFKNQFGFTGEGMPSFSELVLGLITLPHNLMKTVVGKIAGFFGFDQVEGELEAFDFKDLVKRIISSLTDMVSSAADYVIGKFKSAGTAIADIVPDMDSIKNFLKGVLRNILPVADASSSWFSIKNLVAKAIPDSVYEFAGIDPKTGSITDSAVGNVIVGAPTAIRNEEAAQSMQQTQNENTALQSQAAGSGKAPTMNSNSTVNNVSSSNTTVVRPQVMPSRQPNSPSDMIWNGGANTATQ